MAGDTFSTYYGEFAISPIPIELSFNWCSHNCAYCFANLNKPDRKAGVQSTLNLLRNLDKRKSTEAYFLRNKYPVLISNRVDPFAVSNYRQSLPIIELLAQMDIPIAFQTKGGRGIDECLSMVKPSCWYISINSLDENYRKAMEPGAPTFKERLALAEKLVSRGHAVTIGINPAVPEWLPIDEAKKLIKLIAATGAYGIWAEHLHFNATQLNAMPAKARNYFSDEQIKRAKARKVPEGYAKYLREIEDLAVDAKLEVFSVDHSRPSGYWEPYRECYENTFPTNQDFINHLVSEGTPNNSVISIESYLDFMQPQLPTDIARAGHYIGATAHQVCRDDPNWSNHMSYGALLCYLWNDGRIKMSLVRNRAFSYACERDSNGNLTEKLDSNGFRLLTFSTDGYDNYQIEV